MAIRARGRRWCGKGMATWCRKRHAWVGGEGRYLKLVGEAVDRAKQATDGAPVTLLAHSAGGWLSRLYLLNFGTLGIDRLVTLGSPHQPPPKVRLPVPYKLPSSRSPFFTLGHLLHPAGWSPYLSSYPPSSPLLLILLRKGKAASFGLVPPHFSRISGCGLFRCSLSNYLGSGRV